MYHYLYFSLNYIFNVDLYTFYIHTKCHVSLSHLKIQNNNNPRAVFDYVTTKVLCM